MKSITKKQFRTHGWKAGDKVRYIDRDDTKEKSGVVTSIGLNSGFEYVTVTSGKWPYIFREYILEIIPKKEK